jgi:hypothetical protein
LFTPRRERRGERSKRSKFISRVVIHVGKTGLSSVFLPRLLPCEISAECAQDLVLVNVAGFNARLN